jgi:hypothetical protein
MLAELHSHSCYSKRGIVVVEGLNTPKQMVQHAKRIGLDALAITDHDTLTGSRKAKRYGKRYGVHIIPGMEITTESGHVVGLGITEHIKRGLSVEETVDRIHEQGGIAISAHPFDVKNEGINDLCLKCDVIEAFNALNLERIGNIKTRIFAKRHKKPVSAGSDAHCIEMMGHGLTEIHTDDPDKIYSCLKKNRVTLHKKYIPVKVVTDWSIMRLQLSYQEVINYINKNYILPKRVVSKKLLTLVKHSPGKIDYFLRGLAYFSLGNAFLYALFKETLLL